MVKPISLVAHVYDRDVIIDLALLGLMAEAYLDPLHIWRTSSCFH
jgi:hypothetical protein